MFIDCKLYSKVLKEALLYIVQLQGLPYLLARNETLCQFCQSVHVIHHPKNIENKFLAVVNTHIKCFYFVSEAGKFKNYSFFTFWGFFYDSSQIFKF